MPEQQILEIYFTSISSPDLPDVQVDLILVAYEALGQYVLVKYG